MSRTKAPDEVKPENHERWIVSYADMVTLLFALFVVLFATSDANPKKLQQVSASISNAFNVGILSGENGTSPIFDSGAGLNPPFDEIKSRNLTSISRTVNDFTQKNNLQSAVQVRSDKESITISLQDNLLFDSGSASLKPGSQDVLKQVASTLRTLPNAVRIEGHTDNVPVNAVDYATNWELSAARASTVLRFLTDAGGMSPARMSLAGFADTKPVADNGTPEGRALNRRADIVIVYSNQEALPESPTPAGKKQ